MVLDWSPDGPGTPFAGPAFWLLDSARLVTVVLAVIVVVLSVRAAGRAPAGQAARFVALAAFALAAGVTELDHFGDFASPRLLLNIVGCGAGVFGVTRFLGETRPGRG